MATNLINSMYTVVPDMVTTLDGLEPEKGAIVNLNGTLMLGDGSTFNAIGGGSSSVAASSYSVNSDGTYTLVSGLDVIDGINKSVANIYTVTFSENYQILSVSTFLNDAVYRLAKDLFSSAFTVQPRNSTTGTTAVAWKFLISHIPTE